MTTSPLQSAFDLLLKEVLVEYSFDPKIQKQMENGQRRIFEEAKNILCSKFGVLSESVTLEECQRLLFFPNPSDIEVYVRALNERTGRNLL